MSSKGQIHVPFGSSDGIINDGMMNAAALATDAVETAKIKNDAVTNDKLANMTRGTVKVGGAANAPTDLNAKTTGRILVGDGTDLVSVAVSGDATLAANGALTIANAAVTAAKLANGAGWAALLAAGLGASANYIKTTDGVQTLLAANAAARVVLIVITVTEVFADGDGTQPTFKFGETDTDDKYAATTLLASAALGAVKVLAGTLTANKALLVTAATGTGTTETGAISVMAMVLPAAP